MCLNLQYFYEKIKKKKNLAHKKKGGESLGKVHFSTIYFFFLNLSVREKSD